MSAKSAILDENVPQRETNWTEPSNFVRYSKTMLRQLVQIVSGKPTDEIDRTKLGVFLDQLKQSSGSLKFYTCSNLVFVWRLVLHLLKLLFNPTLGNLSNTIVCILLNFLNLLKWHNVSLLRTFVLDLLQLIKDLDDLNVKYVFDNKQPTNDQIYLIGLNTSDFNFPKFQQAETIILFEKLSVQINLQQKKSIVTISKIEILWFSICSFLKLLDEFYLTWRWLNEDLESSILNLTLSLLSHGSISIKIECLNLLTNYLQSKTIPILQGGNLLKLISSICCVKTTTFMKHNEYENENKNENENENEIENEKRILKLRTLSLEDGLAKILKVLYFKKDFLNLNLFSIFSDQFFDSLIWNLKNSKSILLKKNCLEIFSKELTNLDLKKKSILKLFLNFSNEKKIQKELINCFLTIFNSKNTLKKYLEIGNENEINNKQKNNYLFLDNLRYLFHNKLIEISNALKNSNSNNNSSNINNNIVITTTNTTNTNNIKKEIGYDQIKDKNNQRIIKDQKLSILIMDFKIIFLILYKSQNYFKENNNHNKIKDLNKTKKISNCNEEIKFIFNIFYQILSILSINNNQSNFTSSDYKILLKIIYKIKPRLATIEKNQMKIVLQFLENIPNKINIISDYLRIICSLPMNIKSENYLVNFHDIIYSNLINNKKKKLLISYLPFLYSRTNETLKKEIYNYLIYLSQNENNEILLKELSKTIYKIILNIYNQNLIVNEKAIGNEKENTLDRDIEMEKELEVEKQDKMVVEITKEKRKKKSQKIFYEILKNKINNIQQNKNNTLNIFNDWEIFINLLLFNKKKNNIISSGSSSNNNNTTTNNNNNHFNNDNNQNNNNYNKNKISEIVRSKFVNVFALMIKLSPKKILITKTKEIHKFLYLVEDHSKIVRESFLSNVDILFDQGVLLCLNQGSYQENLLYLFKYFQLQLRSNPLEFQKTFLSVLAKIICQINNEYLVQILPTLIPELLSPTKNLRHFTYEKFREIALYKKITIFELFLLAKEELSIKIVEKIQTSPDIVNEISILLFQKSVKQFVEETLPFTITNIFCRLQKDLILTICDILEISISNLIKKYSSLIFSNLFIQQSINSNQLIFRFIKDNCDFELTELIESKVSDLVKEMIFQLGDSVLLFPIEKQEHSEKNQKKEIQGEENHTQVNGVGGSKELKIKNQLEKNSMSRQNNNKYIINGLNLLFQIINENYSEKDLSNLLKRHFHPVLDFLTKKIRFENNKNLIHNNLKINEFISLKERKKAIISLGEFIKLIKTHINSLWPKVMTTLEQTMIKYKRLQLITIDTLFIFIKCLSFDQLGPLLPRIFCLLRENFQRDIPRKVSQIYEYSIFQNEEQLKEFFIDIPLGFKNDNLKKIQFKLESYSKSLNLFQCIVKITKNLKNESNLVRIFSLKELMNLIKTNKKKFLEMPESEDKYEIKVLSNLLDSLLFGCNKTDKRGKILYAKCFGKMGAIDPGLLESKISQNSKKRNFQKEKNYEELIFELINTHLVKVLQSGKRYISHDFAAFAIQELLKLFLTEKKINYYNKLKMKAKRKNKKYQNPKSINDNQILENKILNKSFKPKILDIIRPFLKTRYRPKINNQNQNYFNKILFFNNFKKWLGYWIFEMIEKTEGKEKNIFMACRGVAKDNQETALFLLPYVIQNILIFGKNEDKIKIKNDFIFILNSSINNSQDSNELLNKNDIDTTISITNTNTITNNNQENSSGGGSNGKKKNCNNKINNYQIKKKKGVIEMKIQSIFVVYEQLKKWIEKREKILTNVEIEKIESSSYTMTRTSKKKLALLNRKLAKSDPRIMKYNKSFQEINEKVEWFLKEIPLNLLIQSAKNCNSSIRALIYTEEMIKKEIFQKEKEIKKKIKKNRKKKRKKNANEDNLILSLQKEEGIILSRYSSLLQKLYTNIEESDNLNGISSIRSTPTLEEQIIDYENFGNWTNSLLCYEEALRFETKNSKLHFGLLKCMLNIGHLETMLNTINGLLENKNFNETEKSILNSFGISASWRLGKWDLVKHFLNKNNYQNIFEVNVGELLLLIKNKKHNDFDNDNINKNFKIKLDQARLLIMNSLTPASMDSYERCYQYITKLHILNEIENSYLYLHNNKKNSDNNKNINNITNNNKTDNNIINYNQYDKGNLFKEIIKSRKNVLDQRLNITQQAFKIREPILQTRRILNQLNPFQKDGEIWLQIAKTSRLTNQTQVAFSAILHSRRDLIINENIERAKLHWKINQKHKALSILQQSISKLTIKDHNNNNNNKLVNNNLKKRRNNSSSIKNNSKIGKINIDKYKKKSNRTLNTLAKSNLNNRKRKYFEKGNINKIDPGNSKTSKVAKRQVNDMDIEKEENVEESVEEKKLKNKSISKMYLLLGRWISDLGLKQPKDIIELFGKAIDLEPDWEKGCFYLGRYFDKLFQRYVHQYQREQIIMKNEQNEIKKNSTKRTPKRTRLRKKELDLQRKKKVHFHEKRVEFDINLPLKYAYSAIKNYVRSLIFGNKRVFQSLPRLLTIWFGLGTALNSENNELSDPVFEILQTWKSNQNNSNTTTTGSTSNRRRSGKNSKSSGTKNANNKSFETWFLKINDLIPSLIYKMDSYLWLTALPQLVSRIGHPNKANWKILKKIMIKLIEEYPNQILWSTISMYRSTFKIRKKRVEKIFESQRGNSKNKKLIQQCQKLTQLLINLGTFEIEENQSVLNLKKSIKKLYQLTKLDLIIPKQETLNPILPTKRLKMLSNSYNDNKNKEVRTNKNNERSHREKEEEKDNDDDDDSHRHHHRRHHTHHHHHHQEQQQYVHQPFRNLSKILKYKKTVDILHSQAKPRKLTIYGTEGDQHIFLVKPQDDLRKDARMMEFSNLINKLLIKNIETRKRNLKIKTYAVIPLTEDCGMIEWVSNTNTIKRILDSLYNVHSLKEKNFKDIYYYEDYSKVGRVRNDIYCQDFTVDLQTFEKKILPMFPSVFHKWFLQKFTSPFQWLEARTNYTRSVAVMSMVGYCLGLGDRHSENILIQTKKGGVMHVDFNCLFDKGRGFQFPETVPFRLTHNMIDGFGVLKCEGLFRLSCEFTMKFLRENSEALMCVLETFVQDPLLEWTQGNQKQGSEITNQSAVRTVKRIADRFQGIGKDGVQWSVEGHVNQLIEDATSNANLCKLYIGWMSFY
ncbi:serine/threonine-protein kinase atr [Anaeramoeba flamelloides]|uniref:non-specific serine/threonine protein kinase n=1 Tax=Anaeramoeba flamelloides TaxID=1746091 RepID=A0AAV7ZU16_9EUKA|nr:serine/threonine-protein kinase atr [Anaeramoeba flamelloides]